MDASEAATPAEPKPFATRRRRGGWLALFSITLATTGAAIALAAWAAANDWIFPAIGLPPAGLAIGLWLSPGRRGWRSVLGAVLLLVSLPPLGVFGYQVITLYGDRPEPTRRMLFQGVEYIREIVDEPSAVVHIVRVDLAAEGVEVLVTLPDYPGEELAFKARRTSDFLQQHDLQVAINAGHYHPYRPSISSPYPLPGDPVGVLGASASRGVVYSEPRRHFPMLNVSRDNRAVIAEHPPEPFYNAVTGIKQFDVAEEAAREGGRDDLRARTAVYLDATGRVLFLVVVDGDQPPYAAGISRPALTRLMVKHGAHKGLALDAGGASTLVIESPLGWPKLTNRPMNIGIPGLERPIGTHLGIRARPLTDDADTPSR